MQGMSEREYAAHAGLSRGAIQKAKNSGRLVLHADGSIDTAESDARRAAATDPSKSRPVKAPASKERLKPVPETAVSAVGDINILRNVYTRLGRMGLFRFEGVTQRSVIIEQAEGVLNLLPTVPLGGPATVANRDTRSMRSFTVPWIPHAPAGRTELPCRLQDDQSAHSYLAGIRAE